MGCLPAHRDPAVLLGHGSSIITPLQVANSAPCSPPGKCAKCQGLSPKDQRKAVPWDEQGSPPFQSTPPEKQPEVMSLDQIPPPSSQCFLWFASSPQQLIV